MTGVDTDTDISSANANTLGLEWMTPTGSAVDSSPVVAYDAKLGSTLVYIGTSGGYLEAVNSQNGRIFWSDNLGAPILATPSVYRSDLWVGTFAAPSMYKINATTGSILCRISLGTGSDMSSPTVATPPGGNTSVFFGVQDNGVVSAPFEAVNERTCQVEWTTYPYSVQSGSWNPSSFGVNANGVPMMLGGSANPDSTVYAINAINGTLLWKSQTEGAELSDVGAGITVSPPGHNGYADGVAYYPGEDGKLFALNLTTGIVLWSFNYKQATTPAHAIGGRSAGDLDGTAFIFGTDTGVMSVNAINHTVIWDSARTVAPDTDIVSSPLVAGPSGEQIVAYGDMDGNFLVLNESNGHLLYSFPTGGFIMPSPAISGDRLFIASSNGFLYSFDLGGSTKLTPPTTSLGAPTNHANIVNPNSGSSTTANVTANGTAVVAGSGGHVLVAIQSDGSTGDWWNGAYSAWQPGIVWNRVALSATGTWNFSAPVGTAGAVWTEYARAEASSGAVDPNGSQSTFTILPTPSSPRISFSSTFTGPGDKLYVSGRGFSPKETVQISLPSTVLATPVATKTGSFSNVKIVIPSRLAFGEVGITALGKSSNRSTSAALSVSDPWTQLGENPARLGCLPFDYYLGDQEVPDKIYRYVANRVVNLSAPIDSSAAVANGYIYVGTSAGDIVAVDGDTGAVIWSYSTGGAVNSSPAIDIAANLLIVGSNDDHLYALNLTNGALVWSQNTGGGVSSSPTIVNRTVYVGSESGSLYAINETSGAIAWSHALGSPISGSPAVSAARGLVVVGDNSGDLSAFATGGATPGRQVWGVRLSGVLNTPVVFSTFAYVGSADGTVYAVNASTGATVWSTPIGGAASSTMTVLGGGLLVGSGNGSLFSLAVKTGKVVWTNQTGSAVTGVSSTVGLIFTESAGGQLCAYRVDEKNWLGGVPASLSGTISVSDNALVVGGGNGDLYIFTPYGLPLA